jgi:hypothetical protein
MTRRFVIPALLLVLTLGSGFVAGRVSAAQPHMTTALTHLRQAKGSLERATADKGGHRVKALELTNSAIIEVEAGIEYDRTH